MGKAIDRYGEEHGKLTIREYIGSRKYGGRTRRFCVAECQCGGRLEAPIEQIVRGGITSCGCLRWQVGPASPKWGGHGEISGYYWDHVKRGAVTRGLALEVSIDEPWQQYLKQGGRCAISGLPLSFGAARGKHKTASLDRIDSRRGYVPGNIQWTHKDINRMKQHFDESYFIQLCRTVSEHQERTRGQ